MSAKSYSASDLSFAAMLSDRGSPHGHVCLAVLNSGQPNEKLVVTKSLRQRLAAKADESFTGRDVEGSMKYVNEANNLRKFGDSCPWLNQFFGYTYHKDGKGRVAAVLVWDCLPSYGPVIDVLKAAQPLRPISFGLKCFWIRKLLKALEYLHQQDTLNGNLKSRNVFIDSNFDVKLTDYSTTRWFDLSSLAHPLFRSDTNLISYDFDDSSYIPSTVESCATGFSRSDFKRALPYLSKDRLMGELNLPSDVYSLGVVCWEIATGSYVDMRGIFKDVVTAANMDIVCRLLDSLFNRDALSQDVPIKVRDLLYQCGVGRMSQENQSMNAIQLCQIFEGELAVLSARMELDAEMASLKCLNLRTEHMQKMDQCLSEQNRRRSSHTPSSSISQPSHHSTAPLTNNKVASAPRPSTIQRPPPVSAKIQAEPKTIVTTPSTEKTLSTGFQRLTMDPTIQRMQVQQRFPANQMAEEVTFNGAGCSVKILSQNIKIPMLIQNSNVVINNPATSGGAPESMEREPSPPPPDLLTQSEEQIARNEERLLNKNPISSPEKWEKLGKHLGLTEGKLSDLKMRHEREGMAELSCRLLEAWKEKEAENATKSKLALALWMVDEKDSAKKVQ